MGDKSSIDRYGQQHQYIKKSCSVRQICPGRQGGRQNLPWEGRQGGKQNSPKKLFFWAAFFNPVLGKFSNLRPILSIIFCQGFRISKIFRQPTSRGGGGGAKNRLNGTSKVNTQMDKHTDGHFYLQKESAQRANSLKIISNLH